MNPIQKFALANAAGLGCMMLAHWHFWPKGQILAGLAVDIAGIALVAYGWKKIRA